ncbi:hypothetical protein H257_11505 [Aphanomyces astaci]|uniref:Centrosomal protein 43 n=1 Tax=Aphanomyces astaci TaxID=112090 RepID=W4G3H2_APHAT|nr:hypothetical protein, variant [Aphanomyces astaci]XP_009836772.1 hypothetical protein H257_11505 [Aphanomyces astaci]ETV73835.1 hypothetical protein H257_11505 [Aphanomyces astaci]ETV73836.1 hypothetical protein, variant [Aphanomyces astaci]|eukprot:XP_009836771.1 hypothetical protein, variant [Aphanomyces astaci]
MSAATKAADDEVKLLVTQTLESQGILGQIKAQLRAAVYNAIHNVTHEPTKSKRDLVATKDASLALQVVVEFLRQFNLQQTLSVLTAEASLTEADLSRTRRDVAASLNLSTQQPSSSVTLLIDLINNQVRGHGEHDLPSCQNPSTISNVSPNTSNYARESQDDPLPVKTPTTTTLDSKQQPFASKSPNILAFASHEPPPTKEVPPAVSSMAKAVNQDRETTSIALDDDEGEDEESIASSVYENSIESPAKPPPPQVAVGDLKLDSEASKANDVPPTAPTSLLGTFPPLQSASTLTIPTLANDDVAPTTHDGDDDDEDDDAERLRALDASLKAMEAEDDTGTLSKLKASLQHELEAKSDDDGHYGSDFEEDFEEDAIASDVEEDDETTAHESDNDAPAFKPSGTDKLVASRAALDAYDYVEDVVRP